MVLWYYGYNGTYTIDKAETMKTIRRFRSTIIALIAIIAIVAGIGIGTQSTALASELEPAIVDRVVDGDTLVVTLDNQEEYVRLIGVDTPESVHPDESRNTEAGDVASDYTKSLIAEGSTVYLQKDTSDTDKYNRLLRYVWIEKPTSVNDESEVKSKMLNAILLQNGYAEAKAYEPDTAYADLFSSLESVAQQVSFSMVPVYSQHIMDTGEVKTEVEYYNTNQTASESTSQDWREPIREALSDINLFQTIITIVVIFESIALIGSVVYLLREIYKDRRADKTLSKEYVLLYSITAVFLLIVGLGMLFFAVIFMIP